ncbi:hypothetical protein GYB59_19000 [bacterium]|nr:hypothetical protein [bacterium]
MLDAVNGCEIGRKITLGPEVAEFWAEYLRLGEQIKQLETQRRAMQARVLHAMGPAEIGIIEGAGFELKRSLVKDSFYTDDDVRETKLLVGKVKRNGYVRLGQRKRKSTR